MKRVLGENWALPALDDDNRAFFTSGKLVVQQCSQCEKFQHAPEDICQSCQSFELHNFESQGQGKVESVAVVDHAIHPSLKDKVPYAIVAVSVDDAPGVLIVGNVIGKAPDDIRIGDNVSVVFEEVDDERSGERLRIPQWQAVQ